MGVQHDCANEQGRGDKPYIIEKSGEFPRDGLKTLAQALAQAPSYLDQAAARLDDEAGSDARKDRGSRQKPGQVGAQRNEPVARQPELEGPRPQPQSAQVWHTHAIDQDTYECTDRFAIDSAIKPILRRPPSVLNAKSIYELIAVMRLRLDSDGD